MQYPFFYSIIDITVVAVIVCMEAAGLLGAPPINAIIAVFI